MSAQSNLNRSTSDPKAPINDADQVWGWTCDSLYRVNSVSSGFAIMTGSSSASLIAGKTWWKACDDLDSPDKSWKPLVDCMEERRRIKQFVFSFNHYGKTFKFQINGEPAFVNGKFTGYKGTGTRANENQRTWADLNANKIYEVLETFKIGNALFCKDDLLEDYDSVFTEHLANAGVRPENGMTVSTLKVHLMARNEVVCDTGYNGESAESDETVRFIDLKLKNNEILSLRFGRSANDRIVMKSEMNPPLQLMREHFETSLAELTHEKQLLSDRLRKFQTKSDVETITRTEAPPVRGSDHNALSPLLQNHLDIGIMCTDLAGKILHVNHFGAAALGFVSVKDCIQSAVNHYALPNYDRHRKDIDEQILEQNLDRKERELNIGPPDGKIYVREVITPYPSVFKPEGFFTFWYEALEKKNEEIIDRDPNDLIFETAELFIQQARLAGGNQSEDFYQILNEIQNLFKLRSGGKYFVEEPISIEDILQLCTSKAQEEMLKKSVTANIESLAEPMAMKQIEIMCDRNVFLNGVFAFFSQCVTHTPTGGEVSVAVRSAFDDSLILTLSDNGEKPWDTDHQSGADFQKLTVQRLGLEFHKCAVSVKHYPGVGNTVRIEIPKFRVLDKEFPKNYDDGDTLAV